MVRGLLRTKFSSGSCSSERGTHAPHKEGNTFDSSRHIFFSDVFFAIMAAKNIPEDQKNGLERRVSRFCTISDKTQLLNKNKIGKSYGNFSAQMGLNF